MDTFYVVYFALHIGITLIIDATIALPRQWLMSWQQQIGDFHIRTNNDLLVASRPVWLQAFVWIELLLQVPFFIWAVHDLRRGLTRVYPAALAYGVEAATTTFACLVEVLALPMPVYDKLKLFGIYVPTFLIPLYMAFDFAHRIYHLVETRKTQ